MLTRMLALMLIAFGLLLGSSVAAQNQPRGVKLNNADLEKLTGKGWIADGMLMQKSGIYSVLLQHGGKAFAIGFVTGSEGGGTSDEGTWGIEGDTLCSTIRRFQVPAAQCHTIYQLPDGSYESWFEGKSVSVFRVRIPENKVETFK